MMKLSLDALARRHLAEAASAPAGRSAETVYGGHERTLRQTLIALTAGNALADHPNPGEATLTVLRGRVVLRSKAGSAGSDESAKGADSWEGRAGDLLIIPEAVHALEAVEDSVVLLTVAKT
ncbi:cupin domain-containing protein [Nocardiopsis coralliicola]